MEGDNVRKDRDGKGKEGSKEGRDRRRGELAPSIVGIDARGNGRKGRQVQTIADQWSADCRPADQCSPVQINGGGGEWAIHDRPRPPPP